MPINYCNVLEKQGVNFTAHNNKKKFIDYKKVCNENILKFKSNLEFAFLRMGDPFPLGEKIDIDHVNQKVKGYNNFFINILKTGCPMSYFPPKSEDGWYDREDVEFWFFKVCKTFIKTDIMEFLEANKDTIMYHYDYNFNEQ